MTQRGSFDPPLLGNLVMEFTKRVYFSQFSPLPLSTPPPPIFKVLCLSCWSTLRISLTHQLRSDLPDNRPAVRPGQAGLLPQRGLFCHWEGKGRQEVYITVKMRRWWHLFSQLFMYDKDLLSLYIFSRFLLLNIWTVIVPLKVSKKPVDGRCVFGSQNHRKYQFLTRKVKLGFVFIE